jgi:hypothetical protein
MDPTVESTVLPHPDMDMTSTPVEPQPSPVKPPPPVRQKAEVPPCMRQAEVPPCMRQVSFAPDIEPLDPMVRDLAISLFTAFVLGVSVATIIAVYSRRPVADA